MKSLSHVGVPAVNTICDHVGDIACAGAHTLLFFFFILRDSNFHMTDGI